MNGNQLTLQPQSIEKTSTGIEGFDEITGGGLQRNRTSLVTGGPGSGKTASALQALVVLSPLPIRTIVGDLSDPSIVLPELGLEEGVK